MKILLALAICLAAAVPLAAQPVLLEEFEESDRSLEDFRAKLKRMAPSDPVDVTDEEASRRGKAIVDVAFAAGFKGEVVAGVRPNWYHGDRAPALQRLGYGPGSSAMPVWPWASVTKQVVAYITVREAESFDFDLDAPADRYVKGFGKRHRVPTIRDLLRHTSGLANPENTPPDANGWPSAYSDGTLSPEWCIANRGAPPTEGYSYNNCDYIVLRHILEQVSYMSFDEILEERLIPMGDTPPTLVVTQENVDRLAFIEEPERSLLPAYGAAGGLSGTLLALAIFNESVMNGLMISETARDELWTPDAALDNQALGQWVFEAQPTGCDKPLRVVERRGAIGRYQMLNVMLPDLGQQLIAATPQPEEEFAFGQVWEADSFLHDAIAMLACGAGDSVVAETTP